MNTPKEPMEEKKCDCCGWDDYGYQHEPNCSLKRPTPSPDTKEIPQFAPLKHDWKGRFDQKIKTSSALGGFLITDYDGTWQIDEEVLKSFISSELTLATESLLREVLEKKKYYQLFGGEGEYTVLDDEIIAIAQRHGVNLS